MRLRKLDEGFGAEADEIAPDFRTVWEAFFASQVLVFRGQKFSPSDFLGFAKRFGRPEPHVIDQFHHPEHPDVPLLSNVKQDERPIGLADAVPARATLLYSVEVPKTGGDTLFADQYTEAQERKITWVRHPVVRRHPVTW